MNEVIHDPRVGPERNFKEIVAQAHEGIWIIDADGLTTFANARMGELLGYKPDEMLGQIHTSFMFEADRPHGDVQMEHRRIGTREVWDQRYRRKNGQELWTLATCCPLYENGEFVGALGMFADITERKALESAFKESEMRFRGTFENAAVGMAHVALDGTWLRVNRRLCEMLGFTHEELMSKTFQDITHPDDLAEDVKLAEKVKSGSIPGYTLEKRYRRKDASLFWAELTVSMLHDEDGRPLHFISIVKDISARREAIAELRRSRQELLLASQAKDRFLATLSHELRVPLNCALLVAAESAQDPLLPPQVREQFKIIEDAVSQQAAMINDLLDLTRISSGKIHLRTTRFDLAALLRSLIASMRAMAAPKQMELLLTVPDEMVEISGDTTRLRQVFSNLLGNAIKFTPHAGRVEIKLNRTEEPAQATVTIRDTGIGFTPEEHQRLFQQFAQGDHAEQNPSKFGGLGLGLVITKNLVEQHGGTISASSFGRDLGSVFVVTLPLNVPASARG